MKKKLHTIIIAWMLMPSVAFCICNPFVPNTVLTASALNSAIASPCITSGTINGASINGSTIGATAPAPINGTTLAITDKSTFTTNETSFNLVRPVAASFVFNVNPASSVAQTTDFHGIDIHQYTFGSNYHGYDGTPTKSYPFESTAQHVGGGTIAALHPAFFQTINGSGNVTEAVDLRLWNQNLGTGTILNVTGIRFEDVVNTGGGTPTANQYAFYVNDLVGASSNNYAWYSNIGKVRFGDIVSITPATLGPGLLITQANAQPGLQINHTGAAIPFVVSAVDVNNTGFWAANITGYNYSSLVRTIADGGVTFRIQKDGTSTGTALDIINKGTGNSISVSNGATTIASLAANGNFSTLGSISPASGVVGVANSSVAAAGVVGEYVSSTIASGSAVALTTATVANATSISLTAGDWDVDGVVDFSLSGATTTDWAAGISTTTATLGAQDTYISQPLVLTAHTDSYGLSSPTTRISLAATTTVYLVARATFSAGTVGAYGTLRARRVR